MGAVCSSPHVHDVQDARRINSSIDKQLREEGKRERDLARVLMLGAGESGKTTIAKSMRLIYNKPFEPSELAHYKAQIFRNLLEGICTVLAVMADLGADLEEQNRSHRNRLDDAPELSDGQPFPLKYRDSLAAIWSDANFQSHLYRDDEISVPENLSYFFSDLDRLFQSNFTPTTLDVLNVRGMTTGIQENKFTRSDGRSFLLVDVGGQRSERRKWIHVFEGVTAVLFLVSLIGYSQCLIEDRDSNQMQEALLLFKSIAESPYFKDTSMILFLNKDDLFKRKVLTHPIERFFPDYTRGDHADDYNGGRAYFKQRFLRLSQSRSQEVYTHFTTATDPSLLEETWNRVFHIILTNQLRDAGMIY